jgi:hypothetical protein
MAHNFTLAHGVQWSTRRLCRRRSASTLASTCLPRLVQFLGKEPHTPIDTAMETTCVLWVLFPK